jgi:hypothetical protein
MADRNQPSNTAKDPDDWTTGDETMTGGAGFISPDAMRRGRRGIRFVADQGTGIEAH